MYIYIYQRWNRFGFLTTGTGLNRSDRTGPDGLTAFDHSIDDLWTAMFRLPKKKFTEIPGILKAMPLEHL